jgi:hypothetical protein
LKRLQRTVLPENVWENRPRMFFSNVTKNCPKIAKMHLRLST